MNDSVVTHAGSRQARRFAYVRQVFGAGFVLLLCAPVLYVSGLSRAVGLVVAVVGVATMLGATVAHRGGARPSRPWLIAVAVLLVSVVAYGVSLLIYGAMHPPVAV